MNLPPINPIFYHRIDVGEVKSDILGGYSKLALIFLLDNFLFKRHKPFSSFLTSLIPCPACDSRRVSQLQPGIFFRLALSENADFWLQQST